MRYIIVDGYNVIRADPRLLSFEQVSLQHAREVLVRTLGSAPRLVNDQVTVVFDGGRGTRDHVHSHRVGRVHVLYSRRGQTADDVIVTQAHELVSRGRVVVVSNDVAVRENCRAIGAEVSGSENLLAQVPGKARHASPREDEEQASHSLSTQKRGNPRRAPKRSKRQRDVRF